MAIKISSYSCKCQKLHRFTSSSCCRGFMSHQGQSTLHRLVVCTFCWCCNHFTDEVPDFILRGGVPLTCVCLNHFRDVFIFAKDFFLKHPTTRDFNPSHRNLAFIVKIAARKCVRDCQDFHVILLFLCLTQLPVDAQVRIHAHLHKFLVESSYHFI